MKQTYLAYDGINYKIGTSIDSEKRINNCKTANPNIELLAYGYGIREKALHNLYEEKRVDREWFNLDNKDVNYIIKQLEKQKEMTPLEDKKEFDFYYEFINIKNENRGDKKWTWTTIGEHIEKEQSTVRLAFKNKSLTTLEIKCLSEIYLTKDLGFNDIGGRIKIIMNKYNLNQKQLGEIIGYSDVAVGKIINNAVVPRVNVLESILNKYKEINPSWLIQGLGEITKSTDVNNLNAEFIVKYIEENYNELIKDLFFRTYIENIAYKQMMKNLNFLTNNSI